MVSKPPPLRRASQRQADQVVPEPVAAAEDVENLAQAMPGADATIPEDDEDLATLDELDELEAIEEHSRLVRLFQSFGSCGISLLVHLVALLLMAYLTVPTHDRTAPASVEAMFDPRDEDDPVEFELDTQIQVSNEVTPTSVLSSPLADMAVGAEGMIGMPVLDQQVLAEVASAAEASQISIDHPLAHAPGFHRLIEAVPDKEFKGDPRAIIDDYAEAMDRIAQELMWMMEKGPLLVIWLFDQSGSMKDDQQEIRERLHNVYLQLGMFGRSQAQYLETSVVSFGEGYLQLTQRPTSDLDEIRAAIDAIPEDPSGKESMGQALLRAISSHRDYARRARRQMVLILVSDESGEQDDNRLYIERTVQEANAANCRIYVLGREAVFGYPYAYVRWRHPQTNRVHWLPIDRGPETAFVEQLQIDGFRRRHDAFPSGFGPYEQCRLARETGGIFFMLPSLESNLVRGEKRKYELDIMRPYRPDLERRDEILAERDKYPLRSIIWQCIYDLNPHQSSEVARQIEMRMHFSLNQPEFVRQARAEQAKAINYLTYLARVQKALEGALHHRQQEADPRWQANFDLIYAQLIAYQARIWEYGAACEEFIRNPQTAPPTRSSGQVLQDWRISTRKKTLTEESKPYIDHATDLFQLVIENHPGTPWAQRAQWEKDRGFGVHFQPHYDLPIKPLPKEKPIPVPKL
jgi:hypothetical protein